jgi:hypothetical protein
VSPTIARRAVSAPGKGLAATIRRDDREGIGFAAAHSFRDPGERHRGPENQQDLGELWSTKLDDAVRRADQISNLGPTLVGQDPTGFRELSQLSGCAIEAADDSEGIGRRILLDEGLDRTEIVGACSVPRTSVTERDAYGLPRG